MKKNIIGGFALLLSLLFIFLPSSASDLIICVYFDEIAGDSCSLFYTTDESPSFSGEQCVSADIDHARKMVEFRLDGNLEGHLDSLRLDFPHLTEQLVCVKNISVSSAGVIRKQYDPCRFFAEEHITSTHEVSVTLVRPLNKAYLSAGEDDPYIVLSSDLTGQIENCCSHRALSRFALCLFLFGVYLFARKKPFD